MYMRTSPLDALDSRTKIKEQNLKPTENTFREYVKKKKKEKKKERKKGKKTRGKKGKRRRRKKNKREETKV
jgi:hypothetical protein